MEGDMTNNVLVINNSNKLPKTENKKHTLRNAAIGSIGVAAGWEADYYTKKALKLPIRKWIDKEVINCQAYDYRKYVNTAIKQNNLEADFRVIDLNPNNAEEVKKILKLNLKESKGILKLLEHVFRIPTSDNRNSFNLTKEGKNAFFSQTENAVVCNFEKFSAPIFHEICHKTNSTSSNTFIKTMSKIRNPLAFLVPMIVLAIAVFTDPKEKNGEDKKGFNGFVKKHCGLLAAGALLPLTIEECIANIKGTKIAQNAGVTGDALKNIKKIHKISIISYCANLIATGLSVHIGNKIRDYICSKKEATKSK